MKNTIVGILLGASITLALSFTFVDDDKSQIPDNSDTYIKSIGGISLYSKNPKKLADWYKEHLGSAFETSSEGNTFFTKSFYYNKEDAPNDYCMWSIIKNDDKPKINGQVFTVSYRVKDIDKLVAHLQNLNIEVQGPKEYPNGTYAWLKDIEGNHIELWDN